MSFKQNKKFFEILNYKGIETKTDSYKKLLSISKCGPHLDTRANDNL